MTILIVEDDAIAASYLEQMLTEGGFHVIANVESGKEAITVAKHKKPDLILMDIMLKDAMSGIDAAQNIHRFNKEIKIIFLTAYAEENMIEEAIKSDACGYFLKPYNKSEILANLKILQAQKKLQNVANASVIQLIHPYHYNLEYQQLYCNNQEVHLSKNERKIMDYFCHNTHKVLPFDKLIDHLWDEHKDQDNLRSLIRRIRKKTTYNLIVNINKMGYKIALEV